MTNQRGVPEALPDPSPDQLRAIARTARNSSGSASDDCGPLAYVLHGWRAAAIAFRAQQPAQVEALSAAQAGVPMRERPEGNTLVWVADPTSSTGVKGFFADSVPCPWWYKAGLVFRREQDAAALARTMLSAAPQPSPSPAPALVEQGHVTQAGHDLLMAATLSSATLVSKGRLAEEAPEPAQPGQEGEREMFEAEFSVPGGVRWDGAEYVVSDSYVNSYRCDRFIGQWAAWRARAARAAPQPATANARVTWVPLPDGAELSFEPYTIGSPATLWRLRRNGVHIRWLNEYEQQFVNATINAQREVKP